jgi:Restriction endonuclease
VDFVGTLFSARAGILMSKRSDAFERQIHRLHELVEGEGADVTWNDRIPDPDNPDQSRQIDITIRRAADLTLVECRLHKERQDVKWVEELIGRKQSLRAVSVIGVSSSGFTQGAILKAAAHGIFLRGLDELTPAEVQSWGCSIDMTMYYYEFKDLELSLLFHPDSISRLDMDKLSTELAQFPGRQTLFNTAADKLEKLKLLTKPESERQPATFTLSVRLEGFELCGEPVLEVGFSGRALLVEHKLTAPGLYAYRSPAGAENDTSVVVQKTDHGETGAVIHNAYKMATILDLSGFELPPNSQFRYLSSGANKEMDMDSFEILGTDRLYATRGPMAVIIESSGSKSSA